MGVEAVEDPGVRGLALEVRGRRIAAAEEAQAEMLAESVMAEILVGARPLTSVDGAVLPLQDDPQWTVSVAVQPTEYLELVAVQVRVAQTQDLPGGQSDRELQVRDERSGVAAALERPAEPGGIDVPFEEAPQLALLHAANIGPRASPSERSCQVVSAGLYWRRRIVCACARTWPFS